MNVRLNTTLINNSMKIIRRFKYPGLFTILFFFANCTQTKNSVSGKNNLEQAYYTVDDFKTVEKIDAHVHVNTDQPAFIEQAEEDNFRLLTINWDDANDPPPMEVQQKFAIQH